MTIGYLGKRPDQRDLTLVRDDRAHAEDHRLAVADQVTFTLPASVEALAPAIDLLEVHSVGLHDAPCGSDRSLVAGAGALAREREHAGSPKRLLSPRPYGPIQALSVGRPQQRQRVALVDGPHGRYTEPEAGIAPRKRDDRIAERHVEPPLSDPRR